MYSHCSGPSFLQTLNCDAHHAANELAKSGQFADYHKVMNTACQWRRIPSLNAVGLNYQDIPVFEWLANIDSQIIALSDAFFSSRGVATFTDFEQEVTTQLKRLQIPPLNEVGKANKTNPDEIELDSDSDTENNLNEAEMTTFASFGIGPLHGHSYVAAKWGITKNFKHQNCIPLAEVSQSLMDYISENKSCKNPSDFESFMCQKYNLLSLCDAGILLNQRLFGVMVQSYQVMRHNWYMKEVQLRKAAMEKFDFYDGRAKEAPQKAEENKAVTVSLEVPPKLTPTSNKEVARVFDAIQTKLNTPYSSTYGKLQKVVQELQISNEGTASIFTKENLLLMLTDYFMLHLGKKKWRAKRWKEAMDGVGDVEVVNTKPEEDQSVDVEDTHDFEGAKEQQQKPVDDTKDDIDTLQTKVTDKKDKSKRPISDIDEDKVVKKRPQSSSSVEDVTSVCVSCFACTHKPMNMTANYRHTSYSGKQNMKHVSPSQVSGCVPWTTSLSWQQNFDTNNLQKVGRWGEALVYQYLLSSLPANCVDWVNEGGETKAPYDIKIIDRNGAYSSTIFVEVKTTRSWDRDMFELSLQEWEFMSGGTPVAYHIYRVYGAGHKAPYITVIEDPLQYIQEGSLKLLMGF
eukprot:m.180848 g.180848  ORF g.180848 m.180848 type:complete len:628 (-) comp15503_c3_seq5:28-1911(-)